MGENLRVENHRKVLDITQAVIEKVTPDPYAVNGEVERLRSQVNELTALVGRLFQVIANQGVLTDGQITDVFEWSFTVKED